ncbi:ribosomal protein L18e/L15P [Entophlyctis helioformis]|nr:ribosomal protein L18e/L15P [Entophlyctis helioformis]
MLLRPSIPARLHAAARLHAPARPAFTRSLTLASAAASAPARSRLLPPSASASALCSRLACLSLAASSSSSSPAPPAAVLSTIRSVSLVARPKEFLHTHNVKFAPGSRKKAKRLGRGGKGKTAGRGRKGFKARQGRDRPQRAYEGGQSGITSAIPKIGLQRQGPRLANRLNLRRISLDTLQHWIDAGRLDASRRIGIRELALSGCAGRIRDGVVLLATGAQFLRSPVDIEVTRASLCAIRAVEAVGGKVSTVYHNAEIVRAAIKPQAYLDVPKIILPPNPKDLTRYADPDRRGYLAPLAAGAAKQDIIEKILLETRRKNKN